MKIDVNKIPNRTMRKVYRKINSDFIGPDWIQNTNDSQTNSDSKGSNNSFALSKIPLDTCEAIKKVFMISNETAFDKAYEQVTHRSPLEVRRISVMHSSALCALLCFYRVSCQNKIAIKNANDNVVYNKVYFEVQNKVFNSPSNIDIVLVSDKAKKILFLESKFSEYLKHGQCVCSNKYKDVYDNLEIKKLGYTYANSTDGNSHIILSKGKGTNSFYIEGLKQMIAHFKGVESFCKNEHRCKHFLNNKRYELELPNDYDVYLGEILFNAWDDDDHSFKNYRAEYKKLAERLNDFNEAHGNEFKVLNNVLTYQEVFGENQPYALDEKVKQYYGLDKNCNIKKNY